MPLFRLANVKDGVGVKDGMFFSTTSFPMSLCYSCLMHDSDCLIFFKFSVFYVNNKKLKEHAQAVHFRMSCFINNYM